MNSTVARSSHTLSTNRCGHVATALLLLLLASALPDRANSQVSFVPELVAPCPPGYTHVNSQLVDADGDGKEDLALAFLDSTTGRWKVQVYGSTGQLLSTNDGLSTGPGTAWKGVVGRVAGRAVVFSLSAYSNPLGAYLRLDAVDAMTSTTLDTVTVLLRSSLKGSHAVDTTWVSNFNFARLLDVGGTPTVYAGLRMFERHCNNNYAMLYCWDTYESMIARAVFQSGRFAAADTLNGPGEMVWPDSAGRVVSAGAYQFWSSLESGQYWRLYQAASGVGGKAVAKAAWSTYRGGSHGFEWIGQFACWGDVPIEGHSGPVVFVDKSYFGRGTPDFICFAPDFEESWVVPDPGAANCAATVYGSGTSFLYKGTTPAVGYFMKAGEQVQFYCRDLFTGEILASQAFSWPPVAVLAGSGGQRLVAVDDGANVRLYRIQS